MKLIYIDPNCSGLQIKDIKKDNNKLIAKVLAEEGLYADNCADYIYYVVVDDKGGLRKGEIDFT